MFLWTVGLLASSQRKHGGDARVRRRKKNSAKTCVAEDMAGWRYGGRRYGGRRRAALQFQPADVLVAAPVGELSLGIVAGVALDQFDGAIQ